MNYSSKVLRIFCRIVKEPKSLHSLRFPSIQNVACWFWSSKINNLSCLCSIECLAGVFDRNTKPWRSWSVLLMHFLLVCFGFLFDLGSLRITFWFVRTYPTLLHYKLCLVYAFWNLVFMSFINSTQTPIPEAFRERWDGAIQEDVGGRKGRSEREISLQE